MKALGVDLGEQHVGLAIFDDPELPARPLDTLHVGYDKVVRAVALRAKSEGVTHIVVGLPLRLSGKEGTASRTARAFAAALEKATGLTVALQDERLTTTQAHGNRIAAGVKSREGIDARAAAILLQTWIDTEGHSWRKSPDDDAP